MKNIVAGSVLALGLALAVGPSQAAFITIDDSDPNTVTIIAGDFEGGFTLNGLLFTSGLGNSNSTTLADGAFHSFDARWIDRRAGGSNLELYFGTGTDITSGMAATFTTAPSFSGNASLVGDFYGYDGSVIGNGVIGAPQDGSTQIAGYNGLSISFKSESVPEPASMALLGAGILGLGLVRRNRRS